MKLNYEDINQLSTEEILFILKEKIESIYNSIIFTGITKKTFNEIVLNEINSIKKIEQHNLDYEKILINYIENKISLYVIEIINDNNKAFDIINNYINYYFDDITYNKSINYFNKLDTYFGKLDYVFNPDIVIELINKNDKFKDMIKIIIENNKSIVDLLKKISEDSLQYLAIETYCMLNDIITEDFEDKSTFVGESYSEDSFKQYMNEISKVPLLTIEEEKELATKMKQGSEFARNKLIESNLRLVLKIAHIYSGRGIELSDLVQEGNLGLITAAKKFDIDKGCKFSTYATWWIRQRIQRAISEKGNTIRIPVYVHAKISLYNKTFNLLQDKLGRTPSLEEISKETNIPINQVSIIYKFLKGTISLNSLIGDDDDELESIISSNDKSTEDTVEEELMKEYILNIIENNFKSRDAEIIKYRFGFYDNKLYSLEEIGDIFGITRERVRQIEKKAKKNIKKNLKNGYYNQNNDKKLQNNKFKNQLEKIEDMERREMKKAKTIYEHFNDYTKEQVDNAIGKLNKSDIETFVARYGNDLSIAPTVQITQRQRNKLYGTILPKIKKFLENPDLEIKSRNNKRNKTVYEFFSQYTKVQVDEMLNKLDEEDIELVKIYFENDSSKDILNQVQRNKIYGTLLPKMEKMLKNPNYVYVKRKRKKINDGQNNISKDVKDESLSLSENNCEDNDNYQVDSVIPKKDDNILLNKEECIKILELLKTPTFNQMLEKLSIKEAIIISLRLGYLDNKYFSAESIANFLEIDIEEVNEITKNILILYKDNINNFIDTAISIVSNDNNKVFTLKNTNNK